MDWKEGVDWANIPYDIVNELTTKKVPPFDIQNEEGEEEEEG